MFKRLADYILAQPAPALAWGVSVMLAVGMFGVWLATDRLFADFGVYWRTANSPLDWAYWPGFDYPFPYAPTMLLWISPLRAIPMWPALFLWIAFNIYAVARICRPYLSKAGVALVLVSPPLSRGLMAGQVSSILAALMLWAFGTPNRIAAGMALGVVASIKPQLVIMVPLLLVLRKDKKALVASGLTLAALIIAATLTYGLNIWATWLEALPMFRATLHNGGIIHAAITPGAVAESWGLPPLPFMALGAAAGAWLVYHCRNLDPIESVAAVVVASLLASPYALPYDLAPAAPFLVRAVYRGSYVAAMALFSLAAPIPLLLSFGMLHNQRKAVARPLRTAPAII